MAESSETSLRDAQILDGDGTLANEAANKYLMKARAEAGGCTHWHASESVAGSVGGQYEAGALAAKVVV